MANIGNRPSFKRSGNDIHLEVHVLDFNKNIYDQEVTVEFLKKIREEKKFPTAGDLIRQIQADEVQARSYFRALRKA